MPETLDRETRRARFVLLPGGAPSRILSTAGILIILSSSILALALAYLRHRCSRDSTCLVAEDRAVTRIDRLVLQIEYFASTYFIADYLLRFRTGYYDLDGKLVTSPVMCARRYASSPSCALDTILAVPWVIIFGQQPAADSPVPAGLLRLRGVRSAWRHIRETRLVKAGKSVVAHGGKVRNARGRSVVWFAVRWRRFLWVLRYVGPMIRELKLLVGFVKPLLRSKELARILYRLFSGTKDAAERQQAIVTIQHAFRRRMLGRLRSRAKIRVLERDLGYGKADENTT